MKKIFLVITILLYAIQAFAGWDGDGGWDDSSTKTVARKPAGFDRYTVATLPTMTAGDAGVIVQVTDGDGLDDCLTGLGSDTVLCYWTGSAWSNAGDGSTGIEAGAFDFTTWNANTNGGTKDAIRDQFYVYDTDGDGDIDNIDGAVGGGDITGVGPAGLSAGDALTDGYATSGATLFIFEGTTVDTNEYIINMPAADPAGDLTWTFPSVTGTLLTADGVGTALTALNGENIQDDTIDDDSLDFSDITLDDFVSAEGDYISVASDDIFDFTRNDAGAVTITSSDDDANADLVVVAGGTGALTLGGASNTSITATTDGGSVVIDGLVAIGTDPADQGVIRLENATIIAWEDATETTLTHVDDTGLAINTGLQIGGLLNADGAIALGDGGDNFSVASDGIDIDTSGNITNAGTISSGKVTSSAGFESATGLFDVTGAAAITVGSADVTVITLQTDDTGDGTDLVLPAQSVNGSEMLNNTVTATQLAATLTMADGDLIDLSGITHTAATDEGLVLPNWANVVPTSDKKFLAADGSNLKLYNGGWVTIGASAAPTDATYLTLSLDATLSAERVLTAGYALDFTDAGANGNLTVAMDTTEVSADGSDTWSDGTQAAVAWTYDVVGTDTTLTAGNGVFGLSHPLYIGTDPADAGTIRLENAATILFEASPAGTDVNALTVTSGEIVQIGASGASGVTITPALTITGGIASIGAAADLSGGSVTLGTVVGTVTMATATDVTYKDGTVDPADLADADFGVFTVASGVASLDDGSVAAAKLADADFGSFTVSSGTATIDNGAITAAMMADADHGDVAWSSGVATVEHFTAASESTVADDIGIRFGGAATDWYAEFDDSVDDQMLWHTTATAAIATTDPMFEILVDFGTANGTGMTADQQVFGVAKGTQASNVALLTLDEDGDLAIAGSFTSTGVGDSFITLANNTSYAGSGYQIFFEGGNLIAVEAGTEKTVLNATDGATLTGTSWDFGSVTNFKVPTGNSATADAEGEIAVDTDDQRFMVYAGGSAQIFDFTGDTNGYVLKSNGSGLFTLQADATAGSPTIDTVGDAAGDATISFDINEEMSWQFTGAYTTGTQFLVQQQTGNPTGGVLFEARGADADSTVAKFGDGTNAWTVSTAGLLTNAGTATINLAAANDLTVGGGQIDFDDMAGTANISTTGSIAGNNVNPDAADGATLGTTALEWSDLYLAAGGVIYGENDQSNTLTSSATGWTMNLDLTVTGGDIVLGTTSIFSGGDTASLNNIDAIDATTEATIEAAIDTLANLTSVGAIVSSGTITSSGAYDVTGAVGLDLGSADVTDITLLGQSEDLVLTPSADLWTLSSSTGAVVAITPAVTLTGGIASIGAASDLSGAAVTLGTIAGTIAPSQGASITLSDNNTIAFDATADGMDDDEYNGQTVTGRNCGEGLTQWDLVRLANDADPWHQADANAAGEFPAIGISVAACTDTNPATVLIRGVVRNEGWTGLTPGGAVYLSTTAGGITQTAPSTSGDAVQIVGWALSDSEIYFDFSRPYSEVQ